MDRESIISDLNNVFTSAPSKYRDSYSDQEIKNDIDQVVALSPENNLSVSFSYHDEDTSRLSLKLYQLDSALPLSKILPLLENFGIIVNSAEHYELVKKSGSKVIINDFNLESSLFTEKLSDQHKIVIESTLKNVMMGNLENDEYNKLVMKSEIGINDLIIIRSITQYLKQIKYRYSTENIKDAIINNLDIMISIIKLFKEINRPDISESENGIMIENEIEEKLNAVKKIDEDSILRMIVRVVKSVLRTDFFQNSNSNEFVKTITLKLDSRSIPNIPEPVPLVDTYVYSKDFEGIHLRSDKISRGGIRWSDRADDYRTEVLGLMKAQKVKNSIIIPSGAKGGFIIKNQNTKPNKETVIRCYRQFISSLLDVTDNIIDNKVIHPENVKCHDGEDTYFVVAADKGTADLSDYANSVSKEHNFWLGDAFASGGSNGYDHKKLGITAKGSWESLKRHLQELNIGDAPVTMVAIGDMSGDVFGNGLIYNDKIKLVAAFNHQHIFIDPNPDEIASYKERVRMFNLPGSSWSDYNVNLISNGGGIYERSAKRIKLSDEAQKALSIDADELTPDQLIRSILMAPVDVMYNGGIGTYVKSSKETSENVGDKLNEFCRVNGSDLRCKIVCEGGNLGFTQLGRIEFALKGGLINTDFIDNSAGVDCSDHEVNLKILLNYALDSNVLTESERNVVLSSLEQDICKQVLSDNYHQALVMSITSYHSEKYFDLYKEHINKLESLEILDRSLEYLPTDEDLDNRKSAGVGLTKPELAVVLAYSKGYVKNEIFNSNQIHDKFLVSQLFDYFPKQLQSDYKDFIVDHKLKKNIISTILTNNMIDTMGPTFPFRLTDETGCSITEIAISYLIAMNVFDAKSVFDEIYKLDNKISIDLQYELLHNMRVLINMATRWFAQRIKQYSNYSELSDSYYERVQKLKLIIPSLIQGKTKDYICSISQKFNENGIDNNLALEVSASRVFFTALNITELSVINNLELIKTAKMYFHVGGKFNFVSIRDMLASDSRQGREHISARLALRDSLDSIQRRISALILQSDPSISDIQQLCDNWIEDHNLIVSRWSEIYKNAYSTDGFNYTAMFVALHDFSRMIDGISRIEKISMLAYHDIMTKLPNRAALNERLEKIISSSNENNTPFAVHFVDVNKFKVINDKYGHEVGDKVLVEISNRLSASIRTNDMVARLAGDEFIVVQTGLVNKDSAQHFSKILMAIISKPMYLDNLRLNITASVGYALYPDDATTCIDLISSSDKRMYGEKAKIKVAE